MFESDALVVIECKEVESVLWEYHGNQLYLSLGLLSIQKLACTFNNNDNNNLLQFLRRVRRK